MLLPELMVIAVTFSKRKSNSWNPIDSNDLIIDNLKITESNQLTQFMNQPIVITLDLDLTWSKNTVVPIDSSVVSGKLNLFSIDVIITVHEKTCLTRLLQTFIQFKSSQSVVPVFLKFPISDLGFIEQLNGPTLASWVSDADIFYIIIKLSPSESVCDFFSRPMNYNN